MVSINAKETLTDALKLFREDKLILFFILAVILDFVSTTLGMQFLSTKWEMNWFYKTMWKNKQYLLYAGYWSAMVFANCIIMYYFARARAQCRKIPKYRVLIVATNIFILYLGLQRLYVGGIGWGLALLCNSTSSLESCVSFASSNLVLGTLFQALNTLFPPFV